ncbi:LPS export ABC transporter periplasmic protein LptC [Geoalkalibacter sp.]|uniref:LPS export ABC transporter periplasmic protein LptC n=1 Tax=Geoalkalibacter sp. TaxID=3041440 RepID=UPI00272EDA6F|nr:LPS export ABC transporter periplasmic protein LptC [Geoalkalibacter sp.]
MIKGFQTRRVLVLAIILLLVLLAVLVLRNLPRGRALQEVVETLREADLALQAFEYTETRDGRRQWTVEGDSAGFHQQRNEALIEMPRVFFYDESGERAELTLTAQHGRIDVDARRLWVWGEVVVKGADAYTLFTQSLEYDDAGKLARTDEPVRILSDAFEIHGHGLRLDVTSRRVEIPADVRATLSSGAAQVKP